MGFECSQHIAMINTWGNGYASFPDMIIACDSNITLYPVNMYVYYVSNFQIKKYIYNSVYSTIFNGIFPSFKKREHLEIKQWYISGELTE